MAPTQFIVEQGVHPHPGPVSRRIKTKGKPEDPKVKALPRRRINKKTQIEDQAMTSLPPVEISQDDVLSDPDEDSDMPHLEEKSGSSEAEESEHIADDMEEEQGDSDEDSVMPKL